MTERILDIENLSVAFHDQPVVQGVDLHVDRGETVALVGESGSGKSVTALSILQLLPYPQASHPMGSILLDGYQTVGMDEDRLTALRGNRASMIFQEPMTSLNPLHTIERQVGEVLFVHQDMDRKRVRERTLELLHLVGLPKPEERLRAFPHELSGGQRQRVMIAMALANEPDLLIADEPTTALDVTIQAQILTLLNDLQSRLGMALLLITHDLGIVRKLADRIYVMNGGTIVETGECTNLFDSPQHPYTRQLIDAEPSGQPVPVNPDAPPLMEGRNLRVQFELSRGFLTPRQVLKAVDDISLTVRVGQTVGLVGESGSGKTTLGLALLRLLGSKGSIVFDGIDLQGMKSKALKPYRQMLQVVFQDPFSSLSPRRSVRQIVAQGLQIHEPGLTAAEQEERVNQALTDVGLDPADKDRYPHEFSGGQRQRIAIARAVVLRPRLIVLDEPTSALDRSVQAQIVHLLRDLQTRYDLSYLFVSHDLRVVRALAHHLIVMKDGRIVEQGDAAQIFAAPKHEYTRALLSASLDIEVVGNGVS
ncbi:MAG: ABC transporter ATP-binding protein [Pseudomonadota bacterium]